MLFSSLNHLLITPQNDQNSSLFLTTEATLVVSVSFLSLSWISGKFVWFHHISSHFRVKSMSFGRYLKRTLLFLLLNYRRITLCVLLFCLIDDNERVHSNLTADQCNKDWVRFRHCHIAAAQTHSHNRSYK